MALSFSTKASTLAALTGCLRGARLAPLVVFSVADWADAADACRARVMTELQEGVWIVRSSCLREDGERASQAGAFISVKNVDSACLTEAVQTVIASYGCAAVDDQVLVQPMLRDVVLSGVAFSHDPNTCAPYRVVNWNEGGDTAAVTSGQGGRIWQQAAGSPLPAAGFLAGVVALVEELYALFGQRPVDCEFAVTRSAGVDELWLLQVRPLVLRQMPQGDAAQRTLVALIRDKITRGMGTQPFLLGRRTAYGVMPDWNPAEIIGVRPKPLALSLYRELVTDAIWAYQRHNYGYRNLRSFPLMPHFFGLPYVDTRLSFNSFIPADLDEDLAGRLVDHYLERLLEEPALHDKVEFEIVHSCYTFDLPQRLKHLGRAGFTHAECQDIAGSLRRLTNRILHPKNGLWRTDAAKLTTLDQRRAALAASDADHLARVYWLLEDAKRYGTLPFAGLARAGFVAVQMLRSLVAVGLFSAEDYDVFLAGISTVSGRLARDRALLDRTTFLARYGHLRPGTYDILTPRYDEAPDLYFDWSRQPPAPPPPDAFHIAPPQMRELAKELQAHGLHPDPVGTLDFIRSGIELREQAKFQFTRNLSDALALITEYGQSLGYAHEELAFADVGVFQELHVAAADPRALLDASIRLGQDRYRDTGWLSLPPLITEPDDVWGFEWPETAPNFITQKQVTARKVDCHRLDDLNGAIVLIPNADPGFDWLFSYPIVGLVTAWGGANSHMAVRAGELGLPAVIGAGEIHYRHWELAECLYLDCAGRRVEVLA